MTASRKWRLEANCCHWVTCYPGCLSFGLHIQICQYIQNRSSLSLLLFLLCKSSQAILISCCRACKASKLVFFFHPTSTSVCVNKAERTFSFAASSVISLAAHSPSGASCLSECRSKSLQWSIRTLVFWLCELSCPMPAACPLPIALPLHSFPALPGQVRIASTSWCPNPASLLILGCSACSLPLSRSLFKLSARLLPAILFEMESLYFWTLLTHLLCSGSHPKTPPSALLEILPILLTVVPPSTIIHKGWRFFNWLCLVPHTSP